MQAIFEFGHALLCGLYPRRCCACLDEIDEGRRCGLCPLCEAALLPTGAGRCPVCGRPRPGLPLRFVGEPCRTCAAAPPPFDRAIAPYQHGGPLALALSRFKYDDKPAAAKPLGQLLARAARGFLRSGALRLPDLVLPVPLHKKRLRQRGYNQSALLAREVCRTLNLPVSLDALARIRDTPSQVRQGSRTARSRNLEGAITVMRPETLRARTVLLIDDVFTSGATAAACSKALRTAKPASVHVLTLTRKD